MLSQANAPLTHLLSLICRNGPEYFDLMAADPDLKRVDYEGFTLFTSAKTLPSPKTDVHLFAKGIVFEQETREIVAVPYIKTYNWHERQDVRDAVLKAVMQGAVIDCPVKEDGTLIMVFKDAYGNTRYTTRGTLGEVHESSNFVHHCGLAKEILLAQSPDFEDRMLRHCSYIFELICPESKVITPYGDRREMVLTGMTDILSCRYWTQEELQLEAARLGVSCTQTLSLPEDTQSKLKELREQIKSLLSAGQDHHGQLKTLALEYLDTLITALDQWQPVHEGDQSLCEGAMLNVLLEGDLRFRFKVKTAEYVRALKFKNNLNLSTCIKMLVETPSLIEQEAFLAQITAAGLPEELHPDALVFWEEAKAWVAAREAEFEKVEAYLEGKTFNEPEDFKALAMDLKQREDLATLSKFIFLKARKGLAREGFFEMVTNTL